MKIKWREDVSLPMQLRKKGEVVYLNYDSFEKSGLVIHGFSTRLGGVSTGIYDSMNLSFTRGDDKEAVLENHHRMAQALGVDVHKVVASDQTHTTNVRRVTEKDQGKGVFLEKDYHDVDGLITDIPGITLATFYADCVPLFFLDPIHHAIGLSHSGWRGTVQKMGKVTLEQMKEHFGTDPKDVLAGIGPSICQDCYEVSEDVAMEFASVFPKEEILKLGRREEMVQKYQLNLWKANELVLLEAGVKKEHISYPGICTCCNPEFLFSHRASHGKRGNLGAFLCLKEKTKLDNCSGLGIQ